MLRRPPRPAILLSVLALLAAGTSFAAEEDRGSASVGRGTAVELSGADADPTVEATAPQADGSASQAQGSEPDGESARTTVVAGADTPEQVVATGVDLADPTVLVADGTYVLAGTNTGGGEWVQNVPGATSSDLTHWSSTTDLLPELPTWATEGFTWAPSLTRDGSQFQLYFSALHTGSQRLCVGVATSEHATGPYRSVAEEPLVCQTSLGGSIDPEVVTVDGRRWLMWKNDGNCCGITTRIWVQELAGVELVGSAAPILEADATWEAGVIENPTAATQDGSTVVLYSANDWESGDYGTGIARCVGVWLACEKQSRTATVLAGEVGTVGSGGASFFVDAAGTQRIAWHAWRAGPDGDPVRTVFIDDAARVLG